MLKKLAALTAIMLILAAMIMPTAISLVKAEECIEDDPFTYSPSIHSATVSPGGSTSVTVTLGLAPTGQPGNPRESPPVTTEGWDKSVLPTGWTLIDEIQSPKTKYKWESLNDTVKVKLTLTIPSNAAYKTYNFTLKLKPGEDSASNTIGAGTGIRFSIKVSADNTPPDTSIDSGPSGWINVQTATFTWSGSDDVTPAGNLVYSWRLDGGEWSAFGQRSLPPLQ